MRHVLALTLASLLGAVGVQAGDKPEDTPAAAKTRKLLDTKITVKFKDTRLEDMIDELKEEHVKGIKIILDSKGGVSRNQTITYEGKDVTLADALDKMFAKNGLGYIVISKKGNAYDGVVQIRQGKERGYPLK
jgi:hypothetical protein